MKLGGYVRFQQNFGSTDVTGGPFAGVGGLNTRVSSEDQSYRVRLLLQHDTRQQTAYGTLRTYMILGFSQDSGTDVDITLTVRGAGENTDLRNPRVYPTRRLHLRQGNVVLRLRLVGGSGLQRGCYLIARYRRRGPCGCCLHRSTRQRSVGHNLVRTGTYSRHPLSRFPGGRRRGGAAAADFAGANRLQDIVANLRVDQAWGAAQIAIAAHNSGTSYYGVGIWRR